MAERLDISPSTLPSSSSIQSLVTSAIEAPIPEELCFQREAGTDLRVGFIEAIISRATDEKISLDCLAWISEKLENVFGSEAAIPFITTDASRAQRRTLQQFLAAPENIDYLEHLSAHVITDELIMIANTLDLDLFSLFSRENNVLRSEVLPLLELNLDIDFIFEVLRNRQEILSLITDDRDHTQHRALICVCTQSKEPTVGMVDRAEALTAQSRVLLDATSSILRRFHSGLDIEKLSRIDKELGYRRYTSLSEATLQFMRCTQEQRDIILALFESAEYKTLDVLQLHIESVTRDDADDVFTPLVLNTEIITLAQECSRISGGLIDSSSKNLLDSLMPSDFSMKDMMITAPSKTYPTYAPIEVMILASDPEKITTRRAHIISSIESRRLRLEALRSTITHINEEIAQQRAAASSSASSASSSSSSSSSSTESLSPTRSMGIALNERKIRLHKQEIEKIDQQIRYFNQSLESLDVIEEDYFPAQNPAAAASASAAASTKSDDQSSGCIIA